MNLKNRLNTRRLHTIGFFGLFALLILLSFNRHSKSGLYNYHSEIWADKAGYYVYLPAALLYDFNAANFPDSIDLKTGNGFILHRESKVVETKYSYGVALMQLPFFIGANALAPIIGERQDGFSKVYHRSLNVAASFYASLGLLLLYVFLMRRFGVKNALLATLTLITGTNLYYYSVDETGMSHVYSFVLFSFMLWKLDGVFQLQKPPLVAIVKLCLAAALIVLIRPTNAIFLFFLFALNYSKFQPLLVKLTRKQLVKTFAVLILCWVLVFFPQLIYRYYVSGSIIDYAYGSEGFNWLNPELVKVWFSPFNGLFLYTPVFVAFLIGIFLLLRHKVVEGVIFGVLFVLLSYVFSSWWSWHFGCAFGSRSLVEYYALFAIPLAFLYQESSKWLKWKRYLLTFIVLIFIGLNLKMTYSFDGCFYWTHDWDWDAYFTLLTSPTK